MARASYRRRPDGVLQIVRPHPLQRMGRNVKSAGAALLVVLLSAGLVGLYAAFGVPVILAAGCVVFGAVLWRSAQPRRPAAPVRVVSAKRSVP